MIQFPMLAILAGALLGLDDVPNGDNISISGLFPERLPGLDR